ncbi:polysaccharide deacetylase [Sphaerisporangium sp. NPDC051011]|uniref:polysaccharide deacetylase family protein n=1 Tax=Sphaerisporangium sp. NPDC051011 TaxID=3155792 RepID=UPI0033F4617A
MLSFDVDGPAVWIDDDEEAWSRPRTFSLGTYGPLRGLPRTLDLLDEYQVPSTFFVPGWVCENWSSQVKQIVDAGHELGHHGYLHELYIRRTLDEMREIIARSQEAFAAVGGRPAVGFRGPSGDFPDGSHAMLVDLGFSYSSSMRGDDRPYRWVIDGVTTDLVEIPAQWELDDFPAFGYNDRPVVPEGGDRIASLGDVLDNWKREFDGYYRDGLCYTVMMHPQLMGKPSRIELIRELIEHIRAHDDVWFATGEQIADWWTRSGQ